MKLLHGPTLKVFDKAVTLYQEALNLGIDRDEVLSKLASLYIKNQNPDSATLLPGAASRSRQVEISLQTKTSKLKSFLLKGQAGTGP